MSDSRLVRAERLRRTFHHTGVFTKWRVWPVVLGALIFAGTDALQLQLAVTKTFSDIPRGLMLAPATLAVIAALAVWGRKVHHRRRT